MVMIIAITMIMVIAGLLLIVVMIMAGLLLIMVMVMAGLLLIMVMIIAGFPQTELLRLPSCMLVMFVAMVLLLLLKVQPCLVFFHPMVMVMLFNFVLPSTSVLRMSMADVATKTVAR